MESKIRQGKEGDLFILENNSRTFKVFDCPVELIGKYISYAKLHFDNHVWKVLEKGMQLIMDEETSWKVQTEKRLALLEDKVFKKNKDDEEEEVTTFGTKFVQ